VPESTRPPLEYTVSLGIPPEQAFAMVFSEAERWLCRGASTDLRPGGALRFCWPDGCAEGRVLLFAPPNTARFTFHMEGDPLPETVVVVGLSQDQALPDRTVLSLQHYGFGVGPDWDPLYVGCARAWAGYLKNLRSVADAGVDLRESNE
jgi:uncharacterized protein YndB with AHSA1/START domain